MMLSTQATPILEGSGKPVYQMKTQYLINTARVRLTLPGRGDCWFFVDPELSVHDFKQKCQEEDSNITEVEILQGDSTKPVLN